MDIYTSSKKTHEDEFKHGDIVYYINAKVNRKIAQKAIEI